MIYTECKPDSALVKILGIPQKQVIHLQGKSEVCKQLETKAHWRGLVDDDPLSIQPSYVKRLQAKRDLQNDYGLKVLYDASKSNLLFVLCPKLEDWVLQAAKEADLDVRRYNLPNDSDKLHEVINLNLDKFERLVTDLNTKSKMVRELAKALREGG